MEKKFFKYFILITLPLLIILFTAQQAKERSIDALLLIDSSGSMNWPDRDPEGLRLQGAKLFIDLCENNDRIGIIDFSTDAKIIFPLYEISSSRDKEELKDRIDTIEAKGKFTDITLALETALKEMSRARSDVLKAVILLTDGEIDPDPSRDIFAPYNKDYRQEIREAAGNKKKMADIREKYKNIISPISREILREKIIPSYKKGNIPIFAVAFGKGADKNLLREIADLTVTESGMRNYYFIEKASSIQPVFSEIVELLKKAREKVIEKEVVFAGEKIVHKINIDDFIREVNFKLIFSRKINPEEVSISLRDPNGNIITRDTKREGLGHIFEKGYEIYNIFNPIPGTWEVVIEGKKDIKLDITISTWGRTELKILTEEMKPEYRVGEPIPILASLRIEGKRITSQDFLKNLNFTAWVENPKNEVQKLDLYDDGAHSDKQETDGIYGNLFKNTAIKGYYIVKIIAKGITTGTRTFNFTRETEYRVRVLPKEKPPVVSSTKKLEQKGGFPFLIIILITAGVLFVLLITLFLIKYLRGPSTKEEVLLPPDKQPEIFSITVTVKDGAEEVVGSKQLKHSSVGGKNLVIRREGEEFFISSKEGTLELNNNVVREEEIIIKGGDVIKIGELYFEVQLKPIENKVSLLSITKEQAALKIRLREGQ